MADKGDNQATDASENTGDYGIYYIMDYYGYYDNHTWYIIRVAVTIGRSDI